MSQVVNPITVEVVRNGLAHIANEMATVLRKTSYNMMIYEVRDYCVGIVDPEGNILSQNFGALPIFLADLGPAIVDGVRMHGRDGFQPGDVHAHAVDDGRTEVGEKNRQRAKVLPSS